jgi:hypothetical protein
MKQKEQVRHLHLPIESALSPALQAHDTIAKTPKTDSAFGVQFTTF